MRQTLQNTAEHFQFLNPEHRQIMACKPQYANVIWLGLMSAARKQIDVEAWDFAVVAYCDAFEVAEIILSKKTNSHEINRYVRTATEFIYSLRRCSFNSDVPCLVALIKEQLSKKLALEKVELLCESLTEIAYLPLSEASTRVERLRSIQSKAAVVDIH